MFGRAYHITLLFCMHGLLANCNTAIDSIGLCNSYNTILREIDIFQFKKMLKSINISHISLGINFIIL